MDPISSPELDSEAPLSGAPGQVVGPGGSVVPPQILIPQPVSPPAPSSTPTVTISPSSDGVASPTPPAPAPEVLRPTAVGDSLPPASSVILPPQTATFGAMSYNETAASTKTPFMKKFAGKRMLLMIGLPLVLLGSSTAAYFGYVVPNQPDNIWSKALSNTGKGYDKLAEYAQKQLYDTSNKGMKIDGSFKISGLFVADGDFHGASNGDNGEFSGNLSTSGLKLSVNVRALKSSVNTPDLYIKVDGLQGLASLLGGSDYGSLIQNVDGNWYFIDHTLFEQYANTAGTNVSLTQADIKSILDAVGNAGKQNLFTTDQTKMALQIKQKIGKEKQDGRNVYHFKVAVNKDNLKSYVTNLCTNLRNSSLKKLLNNDNSVLNSALDCSAIKDSVDGIKNDQPIDAWVDLHTKLIHKLRIADSSNPNSYVDISQDYQGGDSFPFSLSIYDKEGTSVNTAGLNLTLNMKTGALNLKSYFKSTGDNAVDGSFEITATPSNDKVDVQKPAGAKDIMQLLNDTGLNDLFASGGGGDAERKTDINAMHGQLEAYWATNGYYPSLAQMNNAGWRAQNMSDLDSEALKDPSGSSANLAGDLATNVYSYKVSPAGCENVKVQCQNYTLTATLADGSAYVKQDLNDTSSSILN